MTRLPIVIAGLLAIGVSGLPFIASVSLPVLVSAAQAAETEQTATFDVPGMTCALCPVTVRKAMEAVKGVQKVEVAFEARTATVVFDPSVASIEAIARASENAGYPASVRN
ncbi:mercury resistance system periplasmic binding protein MerP [Mesorhizobium xinjiangense]|uniref:mercury resistance system periplasmic binding protein MerP n=1 Tax=Mesorhizobium xinjiangense TaxID=2678685 RepID=UPI0012EDD874|nr:mercury resistance system periplasmic binding protein MerP [Mesorhizobium xinjiangense]